MKKKHKRKAGDFEPKWLKIAEVLAIHDKLLALHGGGEGVRSFELLESAIDRPKNVWVYGHTDLIKISSYYADGIVNNHPFIDGNKRTGFVSTIIFLETNNLTFYAPEEEVVLMTLGLASKQFSIELYEDWIRKNTK